MALVPFSTGRSRAEEPSPLFDGLFANISILERLDEFRRRLVRSVIAACVGVLLGFAFVNQVVAFLLGPTRHALPSGTRLIYTQPGEAFGLYIQISLIVGVVLAMPYIMYQLWQVVSPIVPKSARGFSVPFALFTTLGFVAGAAFTHYVAFPYMMAFFASFNTPDLVFMPKLEDVFDLYTKMLLGMGVVFQMPTVVFFLAKIGLVSARFLWRSFRYALLLIFVAAAVITPTGDMVTQTIFAAPMVALYLLSILIAWIFGKARVVPSDITDDAEGS
ncbi:MAG: twin-arginine translocase subunit TatC [Acidobacteriota bacterium]